MVPGNPVGSCFLPSLRIYGDFSLSHLLSPLPVCAGHEYETRVSDSPVLSLAPPPPPQGEELGLLLITVQEQRPASLRESLCTSGSALRDLWGGSETERPQESSQRLNCRWLGMASKEGSFWTVEVP